MDGIPQLSPMMWMIFPVLLVFVMLGLVGVVDDYKSGVVNSDYGGGREVFNKKW